MAAQMVEAVVSLPVLEYESHKISRPIFVIKNRTPP